MASKLYKDGEWLREKYLDEGLTQEEIAEECGVSQGAISYHIGKTDIDTREGGKWIGSETPDEPYTDEEWLREQYHGERKTTVEIGEECGVAANTIRTWMDKYGIERRGQSMAQVKEEKKVHDEDWLREQYVDEQRSMRDIGDEVGMTAGGVKKWINNFGIESRDPHEHYLTGPASHFWGQKGYEYVSARYKIDTDSAAVHQLVAIAEGANPAKVFSNGRYHVHHKNGVKWDNRPENLEFKNGKAHAAMHLNADYDIPNEWEAGADKSALLFALRQLMMDWLESDNAALEMAADELDGTLRGL